MKLTIGMIVKNEEKYLERCLTAIKPILNNVDSELIITDTGSTDSTVEIAKKFTDKVYHFDWIKDFAAARNFGLEKAQGEWFMFLDADDIFRSCDNIIRFFNSGEYKNYNFAFYISRNILDPHNEADYSDLYAPRMTKMFDNTRFVKPVHESLEPNLTPRKIINDIADHYGYAYESIDQRIKKFERNSEILLRRLDEKDYDSGMLFIQLFEAFSLAFRNEEAERYIDRGIEYCKNEKRLLVAVCYTKKAILKHINSQYDDVIALCNDYFAVDSGIRGEKLSSDAEMYGLRANAEMKLGHYDAAVDDFRAFFDMVCDVLDGNFVTDEMFAQNFCYTTAEGYLPSFCDFLDCCIASKRYNDALQQFAALKTDRYPHADRIVNELAGKSFILVKKNGYRGLAQVYGGLTDYGRERFEIKVLNELLEGHKVSVIVENMRAAGEKVPILYEQAQVFEEIFIKSSNCEQQIVDKFNNLCYNNHTNVIDLNMKYGLDISFILKDLDFHIKECVYTACKEITSFYEIAQNYDAANIADCYALLKLAEFYKYIMDTALLGDADEKANAIKMLPAFARIGELYKSRKNCSDSELPDILKAAHIVGNAEKFRQDKQYKACMSAIKSAIAAYAPIGSVMSEYSKWVMDEYETASKAANPQTEMQALAAAIKKNIRAYIAAGDLDAAKKTLEQYRMIAPNDREIEVISGEIDRSL